MQCILPSNSTINQHMTIVSDLYHIYVPCLIYNRKEKKKENKKTEPAFIAYYAYCFINLLQKRTVEIKYISESHANTLFINAHSKLVWPVYIGYLTQKSLKHTLLVFCVIIHLVIAKKRTECISLPKPATRNWMHCDGGVCVSVSFQNQVL